MDEQPEHDAQLPQFPVESDDSNGLEVKLDTEGRVDQDLYCLRCGYNLRTLQSEGRCPECNVLVGRSVLVNRLSICDPKWVARLAHGISWIMWGIVVGVGALVALRMLAGDSVSFLVPGAFFFVFVFIGSWLLSTPNRSCLEGVSWGTVRKVVRLSQLAVLCCILVEAAAIVLKAHTTYLSYCLAVLALVWYFAGLTFGWRLAVLLGDKQLTKQFRNLILGTVLFVVPGGMVSFLPFSRGGGVFVGTCCFGVLGGAACLVWSLYLFDWLKVELEDTAVRARGGQDAYSGFGQ